MNFRNLSKLELDFAPYNREMKYLFRPRKSSIFATGGMTGIQAYKFLFGDDVFDDDDSDQIASNTAPSQSEIDDLRYQNQSLMNINKRLEGLLRRNRNYADAMSVISQTYNDQPSPNLYQGYNNPFYYEEEETSTPGFSLTDFIRPGTRTTTNITNWNMMNEVPEFKVK